MRDSSEHRVQQPVGFGVPSSTRRGSGTSSDEQQRQSPCFQKMTAMETRRGLDDQDVQDDAPASPIVTPSDSIQPLGMPKNPEHLELGRTASPVARRIINKRNLTRAGIFDQIDAFNGREDETPVKSPYGNYQGYVKEEDSPLPDPYPEPYGYRKMEGTPQKIQIRRDKRLVKPAGGNTQTTTGAEASASRYGNSISSFKNQTSLWNTTAVNAFGTHFASNATDCKQFQHVRRPSNSKHHTAVYSPTLIRPNTGKGAPAVLTGCNQPARVDNVQTAKDVGRQSTLDLLRGIIKEHSNRANNANDELMLKKNDTPESVISSHKVSPPDSSYDMRPSMSQMLLSGQKRQQQLLLTEESVSRELFPKQAPVLKTTPPEKIVKVGSRNLKSPMVNQPMSSSRATFTFHQPGKENDMTLFSGLPSLNMGSIQKNNSMLSANPTGSEQAVQ